MAADEEAGSRISATVIGVMVVLLACAIAVIVGLAVRPTGGLSVPKGTTVVHVHLKDYAISMPASLPPGNYLFNIINDGPSPHELVAWKTDGAAGQLPRRSNGEVNEEDSSLEGVLDSGAALAVGESRLLSASLDAGRYAVVCNLPGHYKAGMFTELTVK